ncbi:hypothetical protein Zmor_012991 [Zophobas morio]|uniref:Uncharacterized protein n=1 Tax=Zophobas morio TaxID=2755281 RepID=A0AA38ICZ9_9CUCU|nr:hypothetical protein Zmor_012991 [Zophobas morio]
MASIYNDSTLDKKLIPLLRLLVKLLMYDVDATLSSNICNCQDIRGHTSDRAVSIFPGCIPITLPKYLLMWRELEARLMRCVFCGRGFDVHTRRCEFFNGQKRKRGSKPLFAMFNHCGVWREFSVHGPRTVLI